MLRSLIVLLAVSMPAIGLEIYPKAPPMPEVKSPYTLACEQCQETGKSLAVFVGQPCQEWEGYITVSVTELYGDSTPRIETARAGESWPVWVQTLGRISPAPRQPARTWIPAIRVGLPASFGGSC